MFMIKNKNGFSFIELMVVLGIFSIMLGSGFTLISTGRDAWFITDAQIELQESLRQTLVKVSKELRETGTAGGSLTISSGGVNNSDIVKFSMPILCQAGMNVMDTDSNVAYWGAPLRWGCVNSTCMDKDNNCATIDYKYIQYQLNASGQLVRRVLDDTSALVREDIFAENLTDFQATENGTETVPTTVVTLTATASTKTSLNRQITGSNSLDVYLRNRG